MKTPDISIIIPAYNVEKFIGPCLDSIIRQDGAPDFEIIVIDDGSTDNTAQIVKEYALQYGNIQLIRQKNRGVSLARNAGLERAQGRFVSFVDADDMVGLSYQHMQTYFQNAKDLNLKSDKYHDNLRITFLYFNGNVNMNNIVPEFDTQYFAQLIAPMSDNNTDISFGGKIMLDMNARGLSRHIYEQEKIYGPAAGDKQIILHHANIRESANFALYRRKFLAQANLSFVAHMDLDEDILFTQQAVLRARNIATVCNATYLYNRRMDTLSCFKPQIFGRSPKFELAMIQRHAMILSELGKIPYYKTVYKHFLGRYAMAEQKIQMYPDALLPERCGNCDEKSCVKCPTAEYAAHQINANIAKYMPIQKRPCR